MFLAICSASIPPDNESLTLKNHKNEHIQWEENFCAVLIIIVTENKEVQLFFAMRFRKKN